MLCLHPHLFVEGCGGIPDLFQRCCYDNDVDDDDDDMMIMMMMMMMINTRLPPSLLFLSFFFSSLSLSLFFSVRGNLEKLKRYVTFPRASLF